VVENDEPRIVDQEAEVVNQIFHWRREGKSIYGIAGLLQSRGVKSRKAAYWSPATIRQMLKNTMYVGEYQRCAHTWAVPAIVPRDLFDEVQREMRAVYQRLVGRPSSKYLLRGMLFGICGRRMHGTNATPAVGATGGTTAATASIIAIRAFRHRALSRASALTPSKSCSGEKSGSCSPIRPGFGGWPRPWPSKSGRRLPPAAVLRVSWRTDARQESWRWPKPGFIQPPWPGTRLRS